MQLGLGFRAHVQDLAPDWLGIRSDKARKQCTSQNGLSNTI